MDYSFLKHRLRDDAVHKRAGLEADFARYAARDAVRAADSLPMPENPAPGDSDIHILHVTPTQPGTYTFEVEQIGYTDEVERYAMFEITCIE